MILHKKFLIVLLVLLMSSLNAFPNQVQQQHDTLDLISSRIIMTAALMFAGSCIGAGVDKAIGYGTNNDVLGGILGLKIAQSLGKLEMALSIFEKICKQKDRREYFFAPGLVSTVYATMNLWCLLYIKKS